MTIKKLLLVASTLLLCGTAHAGFKDDLVQLGMSPELATRINKLITNNTLYFRGTTATIAPDTTDGTDNSQLCIASADACTTNGTRGSYVTFAGNEQADTGSIRLQSGNVSGGLITLYAPHSSGYVGIGTNNNNDWQFVRSGAATILKNATGGGNVELSLTGTTLAIQEATGASACSGTATANGTTAVTVSTTCAKTGARIFLSATSDGTGAAANDQGACWATNIVNNTSFDLDCPDANNNAAYNWIIFHEAG